MLETDVSTTKLTRTLILSGVYSISNLILNSATPPGNRFRHCKYYDLPSIILGFGKLRPRFQFDPTLPKINLGQQLGISIKIIPVTLMSRIPKAKIRSNLLFAKVGDNANNILVSFFE